MSLPGSSSSRPGREGNGDSTLVTVMVTLAATFMVVGTIILSIWLHKYYGKFFWQIGG